MSAIELASVQRPDMDAHVATMRRMFGQSFEPGHLHVKDVLDTALLARLDGEDAGTAGVIGFQLTVPGGARVAMDGVTIVVVSPVARRRGLLRAIMDRLLDDARQRGAVVLGLGASESSIYRRFGYGAASFAATAEIETVHAALREPTVDTGRLRSLPLDRAIEVWTEVQGRSRRVGEINPREATWRRMLTAAEPGTGPVLQVVVHEDAAGVVDGFVNYRQELRWRDDVADGTTTVSGFAALTREAHVALWQHVLRLDLCPHLVVERFWLDDPIQHLLADPRRLRVVPRDDLHLRLVDVAAMLEARRYSREDSVVIEVRDQRCADLEGRYRLDGGLDGATCTRSEAAAEIVLDAASLGGVVLGDVSVAALHGAGLVEECRDGAVQRASAMFSWQPRPLLTYMF